VAAVFLSNIPEPLSAATGMEKAGHSPGQSDVPNRVHLMARAPDRKWQTYFLGAGFSRSVGLPNTAELLAEVHALSEREGLGLAARLREAYRYFYPEEAPTFVPEVVDFFSVLRANEDVARGMPGAFEHPTLLTELRLAIARLLCERTRDLIIPGRRLGERRSDHPTGTGDHYK
jgi:hypothetical protein